MIRKVFAILFLLTFVFVGSGYSLDGNRWGQTDTYSLLLRELPRDLFYLGYSREGVSTVVTGTTAIPLGYSIVKLVCATSSKTLANGEESGQVLTLIAVDATGTVTITPATSTGWKSASMDANGETLTLTYIDSTYGWIITGISGTTVTGKNSGE